MARLPVKITAEGPNGEVEEIDLYPDAKCSICGNKPVAMWRGAEEIFVCHNCAIKILPRLVADAIIDDYRAYDKFLRESQAVKTAFLEGIACALHR